MSDTFCHLGARNSFTVNPISVYVNGEIQNPHFNQFGMEAEVRKQVKYMNSIVLIKTKTEKLVFTYAVEE